MTPKEIAERAASLISGDRNRSHGNARDNFENIAAFWNVYLQKKSGGRHLTARDVGIMMALLKVARTLTGTHNVDDYLDGVGYLALSGGMAEEDVGAAPCEEERMQDAPLFGTQFSGGLAGFTTEEMAEACRQQAAAEAAEDLSRYYPHDITPVMQDTKPLMDALARGEEPPPQYAKGLVGGRVGKWDVA